MEEVKYCCVLEAFGIKAERKKVLLTVGIIILAIYLLK